MRSDDLAEFLQVQFLQWFHQQHDVDGRVVRILLAGKTVAGEHAASWNGRDALGRPVASGVYFARLLTAAGELSRRMVLLD